MITFYLSCVVLGGVVVVLQSLFGIFDGDGDAETGGGDHDGSETGTHDTLDLISLRTVSAGIAAFGLTGGGLTSIGMWWWLTLPAAAVVGFVVMLVVALVIRQMGRLESDGSLVMEGVVGERATVYIPIPGSRTGRGKVSTILQGQLIELEAVTEGAPLATGEEVMIMELDDTVVRVIPLSSPSEGAS